MANPFKPQPLGVSLFVTPHVVWIPSPKVLPGASYDVLASMQIMQAVDYVWHTELK